MNSESNYFLDLLLKPSETDIFTLPEVLLEHANDAEPAGLRNRLAGLIPEYSPYSQDDPASGAGSEPSRSDGEEGERTSVGTDGATQPSSA